MSNEKYRLVIEAPVPSVGHVLKALALHKVKIIEHGPVAEVVGATGQEVILQALADNRGKMPRKELMAAYRASGRAGQGAHAIISKLKRSGVLSEKRKELMLTAKARALNGGLINATGGR